MVELRFEIDIATKAEVLRHLDAATALAGARVIVDLRPACFVDCVGLGLLCRTRRRALEQGGRLALVCVHPRQLRILRVTGLHQAFQPVATLGDALEQALAVGDTPGAPAISATSLEMKPIDAARRGESNDQYGVRLRRSGYPGGAPPSRFARTPRNAGTAPATV